MQRPELVGKTVEEIKEYTKNGMTSIWHKDNRGTAVKCGTTLSWFDKGSDTTSDVEEWSIYGDDYRHSQRAFDNRHGIVD